MRDKSFINLDIIWISALRNDENCSSLKTNLRFESSVNSDSIQTIISSRQYKKVV